MANPLCHFEFMSRDPERLKAFYEALFDWNYDDESMRGYTLVNAGAEPTGGVFAAPPGHDGCCLNVYFQVQDIEATLKKVVQNGGKVVVEKTAIPHVGHFAMFTDPDGTTVGIMHPHS